MHFEFSQLISPVYFRKIFLAPIKFVNNNNNSTLSENKSNE